MSALTQGAIDGPEPGVNDPIMIGSPERLALLHRARRLRNRQEALELTADERLAITRRMIALAEAASPAAPGRGTDEPPEHWLERGRRS